MGKKYSHGCKQAFTEPLDPGGSVVRNSPANAGVTSLTPGSGRSHGEGRELLLHLLILNCLQLKIFLLPKWHIFA